MFHVEVPNFIICTHTPTYHRRAISRTRQCKQSSSLLLFCPAPLCKHGRKKMNFKQLSKWMEHEHFWRGRSTGSRLCFCCKLPSFFIVTQSLTYTNEAAKNRKKIYSWEETWNVLAKLGFFLRQLSIFHIVYCCKTPRALSHGCDTWEHGGTSQSHEILWQVLTFVSAVRRVVVAREEKSRYFTSSPFREPLRVCDVYFITTDVSLRFFSCANSFNPSWVCYCHYLANSSTKSCFFSSSAWIEGWSDFPFVCLQHSGKLSDGPENILFCVWSKDETVKWQ